MPPPDAGVFQVKTVSYGKDGHDLNLPIHYGYCPVGGTFQQQRLAPIFQKVAFWRVKDGHSQGKRPSIALRKAVFTTSLIHDRRKPCGIRHNKHLRQGLQQGERRCLGVQIFYSFLFCIVFKLTYLCISHKASRTVTAAQPCYVKNVNPEHDEL